MNFSNLLNPAKKFVSDNTTTLLTGAGVVGSITSCVLTGKATFEAAHILETEREKRYTAHKQHDEEYKFDTVDKIKLVWPQYIPAGVVLTGTVACTIFANRISAKEAAALAAAYSLSQDRFTEYREKVKTSFGEGKETKVRDEVAQDVVARTAPGSTVILTGSGDVMMLDIFSGIYFKSSVEKVKAAINDVNHHILQEDSVELSYFYEQVGIPKTGFSDIVGWNAQMDQVDISIHPVMMEDNTACVAFGFTVEPEHNHAQKF